MNNKFQVYIKGCYSIRIIALSIGLVFMLSAFSILQAQEAGALREEVLRKSSQHFQQGEKLYNQGDYARADEEFKKAQQLLDSLQEPQGVVKKQVQKPEVIKTDKADKLLQDRQEKVPVVVKNSPQQVSRGVDYYAQMALDFAKKGYCQKAISNYLEATRISPNNVHLRYNLAMEYLKTKQFNQALQELNKVIQLNPKDKDAYYNLGVLYESYLRDFYQARFCYAKYLKLARGAADFKEIKERIRKLDEEIKLRRDYRE